MRLDHSNQLASPGLQETYMCRCLELARLGAGRVAPNPMVGALLVHQERIIGEGYHEQFGEAHAEVNCIRSVKSEDLQWVAHSTLYVSLEPCAHHGKTPPCTDLIIEKKIPRVIVGCRDSFEQVNGRGIHKLLAAGVEVIEDVLHDRCTALNKRFLTFHSSHRPYIILKWAQSRDCKIGSLGGKRIFISNDLVNRLVHRWRSEEAGILVGTQTAFLDDPALNVRLWRGAQPARLVVDMNLRLPASLKIFAEGARVIIFNAAEHQQDKHLFFYQVNRDVDLIPQIVQALYQLGIQSVLVEGGAMLLQSFIDTGLWDEARVIQNEELVLGKGSHAPVLEHAALISAEQVRSDSIGYYKKRTA